MGLFLPHKALLSHMEGPRDDQYCYRRIPSGKSAEDGKDSNRSQTTDFTEIYAVPATARHFLIFNSLSSQPNRVTSHTEPC